MRGDKLSLWDVRTGKQTTAWDLAKSKVREKTAKPEEPFHEGVGAVALAPDGKIVAFGVARYQYNRKGAGYLTGRLMLLETATGRLLHQVKREEDVFQTLAFSPDGKYLAAGGRWEVRVWNVGTGKESAKFEGHRAGISSLAFSPDGKQLASASADSTVLIWDVSALK